MGQSEDLRLAVDTKLMSALANVADIDAAGLHGCDDGRTVCEFYEINGDAFLVEKAFFFCRHHGP